MASHSIWIPAIAFLPDTSGNVYPKPSAIDDTNDRFSHEIMAFKDSGTRITASTTFLIPKNYVGTPAGVIVWKATATTGDVVWDADTAAVAAGATFDPSADTDAQTVTTTTDGTALDRNNSAVTFSGTYAADNVVLLKIARDGAQGADTMAAEALFEGFYFTYADA